jgi:hypothetical protein
MWREVAEVGGIAVAACRKEGLGGQRISGRKGGREGKRERTSGETRVCTCVRAHVWVSVCIFFVRVSAGDGGRRGVRLGQVTAGVVMGCYSSPCQASTATRAQNEMEVGVMHFAIIPRRSSCIRAIPVEGWCWKQGQEPDRSQGRRRRQGKSSLSDSHSPKSESLLAAAAAASTRIEA